MGAALALSLSLAACDSGDNGSSGTGDGKPAVTTVPSPTPSPTPSVEPAAYRETLDTALGPLDKALRAVDRASGGKALTRALREAAAAAITAADALTIAPTPDDAADGNTQLILALQDLDKSLDQAGSASGRCAASPRVALGTATGPRSVRNADRSLTRLGYPVRLTLPRTEKPRSRRLENGSLVKDGSRTGLGRLTIDNGTDSDAVVALTRSGRTAFTLYIRKGREATVRGVEDGYYTVFFASGVDWDSAERSFTRDCGFQKFDDRAHFRTVAVTGGTQYTVLKYSLAKSLGGNATTSDVPDDEFPS
ncbi:hypothetical protein [Streptomyces sp. NPDC093109]|uniref:hypothetical protein n=1 Tax=Streptomyces sp. NPDC093109 TaxID=3154977 RepID=UPI00344CE00A